MFYRSHLSDRNSGRHSNYHEGICFSFLRGVFVFLFRNHLLKLTQRRRNYENQLFFDQELGICGGLYRIRNCLAILYRSDSPDRKYAAAHAYSGIIMRLYLRLAVRAHSRDRYPASAKRVVWYAPAISHGIGYGF